jgi:hypothetical protein
MNYKRTKIYFDGSHYIGIPHTEQHWKKRKRNIVKTNKEQEQKVKEIYKSCEERTKKEKTERTIEEVNKEIKDYEKSKELVNKVLEKENRNRIVRLTRLYRKANLQQWNYFCTFTYDNSKLTEDEFKKKLLNCLKHLSSRRDWKYIGVFERSPTNSRLHFHGIFKTQQMVGEFVETKDYSTKNHQMQVANQNTFFLEKFGRNDFKRIENNIGTSDAIQYMLKYIRKTGEKVIYSKHLPTYFKTDILRDDVVCTIGQENRKLLLFDNFRCLDFETGEIFGEVSPEVINKMPKSN